MVPRFVCRGGESTASKPVEEYEHNRSVGKCVVDDGSVRGVGSGSQNSGAVEVQQHSSHQLGSNVVALVEFVQVGYHRARASVVAH